MGALHEGHLALVHAGRRAADSVAASIFVNPLQFGPNEDLARYPRDEAGDLAELRAEGCDLVWMPTVEVMYPPGAVSTIEVGGPSEGWEGTHRPGHFCGVATVCTKLFLQTGADVAMFGEKDWQQFQVVRRMVRDLDMLLRIEGVATVREPDGLAMSSRNRFLAPAERALAPRLAAMMRDVAGRWPMAVRRPRRSLPTPKRRCAGTASGSITWRWSRPNRCARSPPRTARRA
jgi:pantoate--beta-alanine ligase